MSLYVPDPPLDPPKARYVLCGKCEDEIYEYETAYRIPELDAPICESCLKNTFDNLNLAKKAMLLDAEEIVIMLGR